MLLIDEMLSSIRHGGLGLCLISSGGASFVGRVATEEDGERLARKMGREMPSKADPRFVLHRHNGAVGSWAEGTEVVCRFDRHGVRVKD